MTERLVNSVGQSLLAIGLYTVAFESLVLAAREQMQAFITKHEPNAKNAFDTSLSTSNNTLKFCEPWLLEHGVLEKTELAELAAIRRRRNEIAHEGYNKMLQLTVADVEPDVRTMLSITAKIQNWRQATRPDNPDGSRSFYLAPSIFGLYLQVAKELAATKLQVPPDQLDTEARESGVDSGERKI